VQTYILAILLSLGVGGLYAALSQGLILTYRGSGVVNFGYGAVAMLGGYTFAELRNAGRLMVPPLPNPLVILAAPLRLFGVHLDPPDLPTFIDLSGPVGAPLAWLITLFVGGSLGLLLHFLVFRPLRHAPPLARIVASVGVMLVLQSIIALRFGSESKAGFIVLPQDPISILGQNIPVDRFILAGVAVASCLALMAIHRFTRFGWAAEAAAENEKGAILTGLSPQLLAAVNWVISALLATVVGILFSGMTTLNPTNFSLYVIPALAAVLVARFRSFPIATATAFGIAALQQIAIPLQRDVSFLPDVGLGAGLPLIVIIVAMWVMGRGLPSRDTAHAEQLPSAPEPKHALPVGGVLVALALLGGLFLPYVWRGAIINSAIGVVIAASMVLLVGFVGQVSLMQLAVSGMAAVTLARLGGSLGLGFPWAPLLAVAAATLLGIVTALPALRMRGTHLAIVTLAAAQTFEAMVLRRPDILSGGHANVDPPAVGGIKFGINATFPIGRSDAPNPGFAIFVIAVAAGACYILVNVRRSGLGREFVALRSNERSSAATGLSLTRTKVLAFALSAALAGVAGVLSAYRFESVSATSFSTFASLAVLAIAVLGGISRVSGAIVAGVLITGGLMSQVLDSLFHMGAYEPLISSIGLVLTAVLNPNGIAGAVADSVHHVRTRKRTPAAAADNLAAVSA
jgi:branched-chain amino acid transport system permease protein